MNIAVKSADRVVSILNALATVPAGLSFTELLVMLDLPKSSLHALLTTLVEDQMVAYHPVSKHYGLGSRIWELSMVYYDRISLVPLAWPYLQQLQVQFDETVQLAVLEGTDVLYVSKIESTQPLQLASHVGSRLPAYATGLGKAMLACLPDSAVETLYPENSLPRFTDATITSVHHLKERLNRIRAQGYAEDEGEYTAQVHCVAVPIVGWKNQVSGAISISTSVGRCTHDRQSLTAALQEACQQLSAQMGAVDPEGWRHHASGLGKVAEIRPQLL